jgi:D-sedoheptulose 7-phosphate isomerase
VAVEFAHPVIVGKRALPAISLANDASALTGVAGTAGYAAAFAAQVRLLGRPEDVAVGFLPADGPGNVAAALAAARAMGMLTIALALGEPDTGAGAAVDHLLVARTGDPLIAREIHITMYHVLWELVHVFLEQPGLLPAEARR